MPRVPLWSRSLGCRCQRPLPGAIPGASPAWSRRGCDTRPTAPGARSTRARSDQEARRTRSKRRCSRGHARGPSPQSAFLSRVCGSRRSAPRGAAQKPPSAQSNRRRVAPPARCWGRGGPCGVGNGPRGTLPAPESTRAQSAYLLLGARAWVASCLSFSLPWLALPLLGGLSPPTPRPSFRGLPGSPRLRNPGCSRPRHKPFVCRQSLLPSGSKTTSAQGPRTSLSLREATSELRRAGTPAPGTRGDGKATGLLVNSFRIFSQLLSLVRCWRDRGTRERRGARRPVREGGCGDGPRGAELVPVTLTPAAFAPVRPTP